MNKKRLVENVLFPVLAAAFLFLIWFIAAKAEDNVLALPYPKEVLSRFFMLWREKNFYRSLFGTIERTFLCFAISFAFALVFAVIAELFSPSKKFLSPVVSVLRSAPTVAVILVLYAFLPAKKMSVIVGFLIGFPVLYSSFSAALSATDKSLITMSKAYKVPVLRRVFSVYIPSVLPAVFEASRSTLSLTLKVVIAAEILTLVPVSLGGKIQTAYASFEIEYLLAWTLLAIAISYVLEIVVSAIKFLVVRWER